MARTINEIRDNLLKENSNQKDPKLRQMYADGVLDMYLDIKRELIHERRKEPAVSSRA